MTYNGNKHTAWHAEENYTRWQVVATTVSGKPNGMPQPSSDLFDPAISPQRIILVEGNMKTFTIRHPLPAYTDERDISELCRRDVFVHFYAEQYKNKAVKSIEYWTLDSEYRLFIGNSRTIRADMYMKEEEDGDWSDKTKLCTIILDENNDLEKVIDENNRNIINLFPQDLWIFHIKTIIDDQTIPPQHRVYLD